MRKRVQGKTKLTWEREKDWNGLCRYKDQTARKSSFFIYRVMPFTGFAWTLSGGGGLASPRLSFFTNRLPQCFPVPSEIKFDVWHHYRLIGWKTSTL
jgi:hypothetical protein